MADAVEVGGGGRRERECVCMCARARVCVCVGYLSQHRCRHISCARPLQTMRHVDEACIRTVRSIFPPVLPSSARYHQSLPCSNHHQLQPDCTAQTTIEGRELVSPQPGYGYLQPGYPQPQPSYSMRCSEREQLIANTDNTTTPPLSGPCHTTAPQVSHSTIS